MRRRHTPEAVSSPTPSTQHPAPAVEIICIGSELLSGKPNTHIDYFALRLKTVGLAVSRCTTVADSLPNLAEAFASALARADVVIAAGGLGPTFDDLTREALARAAGRGLRFVPKLFAGIRAKFRRARVRMPEMNRRQAYLLEGARPLDNPNGSAPGQVLELPKRSPSPFGRGTKGEGKCLVFLLPGPFNEMSPMFERHVLPVLRRRFGGKTVYETLSLHFAGLAESAVDEAMAPVFRSVPGSVRFTILGGHGLTHVYATAAAPTRAAALRRLAGIRRRIPRSLDAHLYSDGEETLEATVGGMLRKAAKTLAAAESCTGGLLSARITDVPGSSDYFLGGLIAYSNALKTRDLGVSPETLRRHGAVSAPCAFEMAEGARRRFGSDLALSITGIAGPAGGTPGKPVGLVYIALASAGRDTQVREIMGHGDRLRIRSQSANAALDILRKALLLVPLALAGCVSGGKASPAAVPAPPPRAAAPQAPAMDFKELAERYFKADQPRNIRGTRRVFVPQFRVAFVTAEGSSSAAAASLAGVDHAALQGVADKMFEDLVAQLRAAGLDVVSRQRIGENALFKTLQRAATPVRQDFGTKQTPTRGQALVFTPTGMPFLLMTGDPGASMTQAMKDDGIEKNLALLQKALGAGPLLAEVKVHFAEFAGSQGAYKAGVGATASVTMYGPEVRCFQVRGKETCGNTQVARFWTPSRFPVDDAFVASREAVSGGQSQLLGFASGGKVDRLTAAPSDYKAAVLKAASALNRMLAEKIRSAR